MRIAGAGGKGGGGGGRVAQEEPDSLRSKSYAQVLDLIGEGEIEGLVDGAKSIYLNDTPLQNSDDTYNFKDVAWVTRVGTQSQPYIPGITSVENTVQVSVEVKKATPVVRTYTNASLSAIGVTIGIPQLTRQDRKNGDIFGSTVEIKIEIQTAGGGFVEQDLAGRQIITGKTTSRYQRTYRLPVTGAGPWDVRVTRITDDSTDSALQNKTFWDSSTEIIDAKLRYPNSAIVGILIDAEQFSAIPTRAYDMKLLRVRVPSNYDPETRAYDGAWDGTFKIAWTDNPAWCFYDLLTTQRYGLGNFIDTSQVDKWSLYSIGRYCDELVPNGFGGFEPRFTCNMYLQTREEAYKVISDMAAIFRGMAFWASGSVTAVQDAPSTPVALFTPSNVIDGMFTYSGSSLKARHTVALVTWSDMDDLGRQHVEYVEDPEGIERYGVITTEIAAIGCTSRGQANRVGRWLLYSERMESETVTFKTGIEGMVARPGQIIKIADPARAGVRYGGRITSSSATSIGIDSPVTLTAGLAYTLSVLMSDGTVQDRAITHSGGTLSTLTVSTPLEDVPAVGSVWILASAAVEAQTFRVLGVRENERSEFEVVALAHNPDKYAAVEQGLTLEPRSYSVLSATPATPTNLSVSESMYRTPSGVFVRLSASWSPVATATGYAVTYRPDGGNPQPEIITNTPSVDIDVTEGIYTVSVVAINALGARSPASVSAQYQVLGKTTPPGNVTGFVVARNGDVLNFAWTPVTDIDLDHYEIRQGSSWASGVVVGSTVTNAFSWTAPRGGQFLAKAVDTSGNYSEVEAVISAADVSGINVVLTSSEATRGWNGTTNDAAVITNAGTTGVTLQGDQPWSTYTQPWSEYIRSWVRLDPVTFGTYTTEPIDIGYVATSTVTLDTLLQSLQDQGPWSTFTEPWSFYAAPAYTWEGRAGGIEATFEISTSTDGITYSAFGRFVPGAYTARYFKIRANISTADVEILPFLTSLIVKVDVPDRVLHFADVAIPISGATLTFTPQFVDIETVQVTLQSAASGDRFTVTGKSASSVTVNVFDSAGNPKTGSADVDVFGYGEKF